MMQTPATNAARPREVTIAGALLVLMGIVLVVSGGVGLLERDVAAQAVRDAESGVTLSEDLISALTLVVSLLVMALGGLLLLGGIAVRRGRQWGRVLAFVGAGIMIAFNAIGALGGAGLLAVAFLGASVGVVALLMQAAVTPYFTPRRKESSDD